MQSPVAIPAAPEPRLPPELILEIASWLEALEPREGAGTVFNRGQVGSTVALRALYHSCRMLRSVFVTVMWVHMDKFFTGVDGLSLERRMREITRATFIVNHVKSVSISLHGPALATTERATLLVECLCAFPHLKTFEIISFKSDRPAKIHGTFQFLYAAFSGCSFPSVRRLALADDLWPIISSFPNVRSLACGEDRPTSGFKLMKAAKNNLPRLEEVVYVGSSRVMIGCESFDIFLHIRKNPN
ncbi:hypothetical protein C8R43DRAFT_1113449 [Mycena crocata]|nr:hypothetical protein C8R43DRAFT_1113449 [Mycena crocata]